MTRIGIYSAGLWRLRHEVALLTGARPVRRLLTTRGVQAVAGWGFKPTAARARTLAARAGLPYLAIEDGFLRSREPGNAARSVSYVVDRVGIYYDARGPSALEALVRHRSTQPGAAAADAAAPIRAIRDGGLSKYTFFEAADRKAFLQEYRDDDCVLVVDQTVADAAIAGAGADRTTFRAMLIAAVVENPGRRVLVKTHPETQIGRRAGYFDAALFAEAEAANPALRAARAAGHVAVVTGRIAPTDIFSRVDRVYAVSSQLGFEALIAGKPVTVFGQSFYADWGLTDDRMPPTGRRVGTTLSCLVAAAFRDYTRYFTVRRREPCDFETAAAALGHDTIA
jgi:capsule polysaccharide export protein KpsC/LpsZ